MGKKCVGNLFFSLLENILYSVRLCPPAVLELNAQ